MDRENDPLELHSGPHGGDRNVAIRIVRSSRAQITKALVRLTPCPPRRGVAVCEVWLSNSGLSATWVRQCGGAPAS
jgi:hypothetical protein